MGRPGRVVAIGCVLAVLAIVGRYGGTTLVVERQLDDPDAIVSLASHEWERLPDAARLARQHPQARVLLTVPPAITELNCHDCGRRVARLGRMGVDERRIALVPIALPGTFGEAAASLEFAKETGVHRLLVVTSPYHTRRALAAFRKVFAGAGVQIGIHPSTASSAADPRHWWRRPYDRWYVRYEWLATAYYILRYGISPFAGPDS